MMPATAYDPISSALKNSFNGGVKGGGGSKGLSTVQLEGALQKSMLLPVQFDDPVIQSSSLSQAQKSKYTLLNPASSNNSSKGSDDNGNVVPGSPKSQVCARLDGVPLPKLTLYRRDQVELGYRSTCGPGAGMYNMGNTCYLNSTIQALFHTPAFVNYLRQGGHTHGAEQQGFSCTICILAATLRNSTQSHVIKPAKIYEKLKMICKHLVHGRQEDAHEFLRYLIESLQKCYLVSRRIPNLSSLDNYSKETTPFNQIFGGYMRQDVVCLKCRHTSTTLQHFMDLLLDIRQADNIDSALAGYFRRENLGQGENMYRCEKCKQKVPATKQYKIERPPLVLCIQLKRFNLAGGKNGRPITLQRKLAISQHVRWAASRNIAVEYRLVSTINHVGPSPNCGHYTSIGEAGNGIFHMFDDSSVHPTSLQNALNSSAYVIFYEMMPKSKAAILTPPAPPAINGNKISSSPLLKPYTNGVEKSNSPKVIGPQLPSSKLIGPKIQQQPPSNRPSLISEPSKSVKPVPTPKLILEPSKVKPQSSPVGSSIDQSRSNLASKSLVTGPKLIVKSPNLPISPKSVPYTCPASLKPGGLVPYGNDSSSEDEADPMALKVKPKSRSPTPATFRKNSPSKPQQIDSTKASTSPFLPRSVAVNFKKLKDTVKNELPSVLESANKALNSKEDSFKSSDNEPKVQEKPNRDPSAEALYADLSPNQIRTVSPSNHRRSPKSASVRNDFTVSDSEAHNPSISSDTSTGSTSSFTVSDIQNGKVRKSNSNLNGNNSTSKQKWNITTSVKRERSVPPQAAMAKKSIVDDSKEKDESSSDTEALGSPQKRKKLVSSSSSSVTEKQNLFEKAAEIGKDVWNAGTKLGLNLFKSKSSRSSQESDDGRRDYESESITSCEATTSHQGDKATSSTIVSSSKNDVSSFDGDEEIEEDFRNPKKHKKKKKKKKKHHEDREIDVWEEKTKDNLSKYENLSNRNDNSRDSDASKSVKESSCNPDAPVKKWDSKPEPKSLGRSMTWDGSKGSDVLDELLKGSEIRSWNGGRSALEKNQEARKRSAEYDLDEDLDQGKVKKVKKRKEEAGAYKWADVNPFQVAQNITNRGDKYHGRSNSHDGRRPGDSHRDVNSSCSKKPYDYQGPRNHDGPRKDHHSEYNKYSNGDRQKSDKYYKSHHNHEKKNGESRWKDHDRY